MIDFVDWKLDLFEVCKMGKDITIDDSDPFGWVFAITEY